MDKKVISVLDTGAAPGSDMDQTKAFQAALDKIWQLGGGVVEVPAGAYRISSIRLRSNTTLFLRSGALLSGSRDPEDYNITETETLEPLDEQWRTKKLWEPFVKGQKRCYDFMKPGSRWNNAMIRAIGAKNISVRAEEGAVIDGRDCYDELGEERYRGPHGISVHHCENVSFSGYTIKNTGNWAHCIFDTKGIMMEHVTVLAGHDGIHMTTCSDIHIKDSEFYTGDDCIAGFSNVNTLVENCICNTACSGMRFGGTNALIRNCRFFGPARYFFRGSLSLEEKKNGAQAHMPHRTNMLSVFTYYADFSVDIPLEPGNILLKDCSVTNVDRLLHFNFSGNERWQSHRPLRSIAFENIDAKGIGMPLTAYGSADEPLSLEIRDCRVGFREEVGETAFLHTANFEKIVLENLAIDKKWDAPLIKTWTKGGELVLKNVSCPLPKDDQILFTQEPFVCRAF